MKKEEALKLVATSIKKQKIKKWTKSNYRYCFD